MNQYRDKPTYLSVAGSGKPILHCNPASLSPYCWVQHFQLCPCQLNFLGYNGVAILTPETAGQQDTQKHHAQNPPLLNSHKGQIAGECQALNRWAILTVRAIGPCTQM